ncbi:MAG: GIY-YIG nuclease family protein, partial [Turicibacter sanguinis]
MKQEVEERKQLEQQRKQVEKEEAKYIGEINKVKELLLITDNQDKLSQLNNKIEELQRQLFDVEQKKDDII